MVEASRAYRRGYKLWDYMAKFQKSIILTLNFYTHQFKSSKGSLEKDIASELEIFLID